MKSNSVHPGANPDGESEIEESSALGSASETEAERATRAVQLLPVHAAPNTGKNGLKITRGPGRPRKVERAATVSDLEYHARISEQKAEHVDYDPLVRATLHHADSSDVLHLVKTEVAKEAASLHFQRLENEKFGRDTSQVSSRRIDALTKIANIELEIKKIGANTLDLKNEKIQRVFKYFIGKIKDVATETLPPEQIDLFFNRLSTALEGWEDECAALVATKE